jgi:uncharacterized protein involved in exopolysaccharide biosynthesis
MTTQSVALEPQVDFRAYIGVVRRRLLHLIVPVAIIFVAVCAVAYLLSPVYEATAKILIESQEIRAELAASTVVASPSERLQIIQQKLMTRDNLLAIARKFDLYASSRQQLSPSDLVARMQSATDIELLDLQAEAAAEEAKRTGKKDAAALIPKPRPNDQQAVGFTVSFDYSDPEIAARVANELVDYILQQNLESRTSIAAWTSKFFDQQVAGYNKKLADVEAQIVEFKKKNEAALPDTLTYRETTLSQLQTEASAIDLQINQLRIVGEQHAQTLSDQLDVAKRQLSDTQSERQSVTELAKKGFYPDNKIREFDRKIAELQADVQRLTSQVANQTGEASDNGTQIASLHARRTDLDKRIADLSEGIARTPAVEIEYQALTRNYEGLQQQLKDAQTKMASATTGEQLEQDRHAERLEVIEQAAVPDQPIKPNRLKILLAGGAGSIVVGVGFVVLLEMLDRSVRTSADLERQLQLRPISVIPYVATAAERERKKWRTLLSWMVVAAIIGLAVFIAVVFLPMDALFTKLLNLFHLGR